MLVLSRHRNEKVFITVPKSDQPILIEVLIVEVHGDKVRVGFDAPLAVKIHREEVQQRIDREQWHGEQDRPEGGS